MKVLFQLFILFCAAILVKGCSSKKSDTIEFGRGGVMSVESKPGVYDFSEDGRYLWLTETNCYDLSGCSVDASKLRGASLPIARMRFKKHVMGPAWNYSFNNHAQKSEINKEKIESLIVQWGQTNLLRAAECELRCLSSQLTFPEISAPMVTAEVLLSDTPRLSDRTTSPSLRAPSRIERRQPSPSRSRYSRSSSTGQFP